MGGCRPVPVTDDPGIVARKRTLSSYGRLWGTPTKNSRMADRAEPISLQEHTEPALIAARFAERLIYREDQ
jgi:hypothetical protein